MGVSRSFLLSSRFRRKEFGRRVAYPPKNRYSPVEGLGVEGLGFRVAGFMPPSKALRPLCAQNPKP